MHYLPYGVPHIFEQTWKNLVLLCVIIVALIVVVDFLVLPSLHLTEEERHIVEVIDILAVIVIGIDLIRHYIRSTDKKTFLKENAFLILSFIPYFGALQLLRILVALKPISILIKLMFHWKDFKNAVKKELETDAQLLRRKMFRTHGRIR